MKFGVSTFLWVSPFDTHSFGQVDKVKQMGLDTIEIPVENKTLINWEKPKAPHDGFALKKEDAYGDKGFWAPQVIEKEGRFYMAYTANENIAIAEADNPLGPFKQSEKVLLEAPVKQIDPFFLIQKNNLI